MNEKTAKLCISPEHTILEAIKVLDETHERIVLIVEDDKLMGVLTDSDVRKWILKSQNMMEMVTAAMTQDPVCVTEGEAHRALRLMEDHGIDAVPVIGNDRKLLDILFRYETAEKKRHSGERITAPVVVMAGGKGTRLRPYTQVLPKPLLPIGTTTILEQVIDTFREAGCSRFYISIHYKKNLIKAYFQDLHPCYEVHYLEEEGFLGTAGSLYLVKDEMKEPFFVSNCDILLDVDYGKVMQFHKKNENVITLVTSLKNYTIPYGVINLNKEGQVESLSEKPEMSFLVNTGVYLLNPETLGFIPREKFMHITDLIQVCLDRGKKVGVYPITEKAWEDMGEFSSLEEMLKARGLQE